MVDKCPGVTNIRTPTFTHDQIKKIYALKKGEIVKRLKEFEQLWLDGSDAEIFAELVFCILTPQSKAKVCWEAIMNLREKGLLLVGSDRQIENELYGVRFKNKKARYITLAREIFRNTDKVCVKTVLEQFDDVQEMREWLVKNINGLGYKEASHFLRNIGFGESFAILIDIY